MSTALVDLTGRHAVVTGAGRGLGESVARLLAGLGARVSALDVDVDCVTATAARISATGGAATAFRCDVTDGDSVADAFRQLSSAGPADILVNNAGINLRAPSMDITDEQWARLFAVNLTGSFRCARRFAEQLPPRADAPGQAAVVNISSIGGSTSLGRGNFSYGVSKAGIEQMTRELAVAWAGRGIRVNAIAPCQIATEGLRALSRGPSAEGRLLDTFLRGIPLGRLVEPDEVAAAVAFLASDAAAMITGVVLPVDGGNLALNAGGTIGE